jgi:hypothetical protein
MGSEALKDSPFYQEIQNEVRREDILRVLSIRFGGEKARQFQEDLQAVSDPEHLAELLAAAVKSRRLAGFRDLLAALRR